MRVIEQLVQHFWTRGALTRDEALYLVKHGFVREADLPGLVEALEPVLPNSPPPAEDPRFDPKAVEAEVLEDELTGRNSGGGRKGGKKKPAGHNVAPAAARLAVHLAAREPYPALHELGQRLQKKCPAWRDAAQVVAAAKPADLEAALVSLLNARARALGELWFWFDLEPLFAWAEHPDNAGPVADAIGKLLRADTPGRVGRLEQLKKAPEVQALADLLAARRPFLAVLPALYDHYFEKLGQWLIPPAGVAAGPWPALSWAFVLVYNARLKTPDAPPHCYPVEDQTGSDFEVIQRSVLMTADLINPAGKLLSTPAAVGADSGHAGVYWHHRDVLSRSTLHCPNNWKV